MSGGLTTDAWSCLEHTCASKSHTWIMGLRDIHTNTTTKNRSIVDYRQIVKSIFETLALTGSPMAKDELIHTTLRGLCFELRRSLQQSAHLILSFPLKSYMTN